MIGSFGFLSVFTHGFKDSLSSTTVQYNGTILTKSDSSLSLYSGYDITFDVFSLGGDKDYTVEIVPYGDFDFAIERKTVVKDDEGDYEYSYYEDVSYAETITEIPKVYYNVTKFSKGFILKFVDYFDVYHLISDLVEAPIDIPSDSLGNCFALKISFEGEEESYKIPFDTSVVAMSFDEFIYF